VNVGVKDPRQCEFSASVDHVIARIRRKFIALADPDDAVVLNDQRAVANDAAARIHRDEIVDVGND
jgi:hypothetical protein